MTNKYYRHPWTKDKVDLLIHWWPHFGTYGMAPMLGLNRRQVKAKVNKLRLVILPKEKRLCLSCKERYQYARHAGLFCNFCHLLRRKEKRRSSDRPLETWIREATNTARHRSREPSDLTTKFMVDLWHRQNGKCYYSGLPMLQPIYGSGRNLYVASIDRIDSKKGYTQNNVVWCCFICNAGKQELTSGEYINLCSQVALHQRGQQESDHDIINVL